MFDTEGLDLEFITEYRCLYCNKLICAMEAFTYNTHCRMCYKVVEAERVAKRQREIAAQQLRMKQWQNR